MGSRTMVNRWGRAALCSGTAAVLVLGLVACSAPDVSPSVIPEPSASASTTATASAEWGSYGSRDDACAAVAGDVLTLALAPKNLALADPGSGVDDIDDTIRTAGEAAPPAIAPNYVQLSAIVQAFGRELSAWDVAVQAASAPAGASAATSTGTGGATGAATVGATATPSPAPERPEFVDAPFTAQLERIKAWLSDTCG